MLFFLVVIETKLMHVDFYSIGVEESINAKANLAAAFVALFVMPPVLLLPSRPLLIDSVPEPTLWQSATLFIGQFLVFGLAVKAWNQRQRLREREREAERWKYRVELAGWDKNLA